MQYLRKLAVPELILVLLALFFTFRELGTFPSAWEDDSVFMLVARMFAEGKGYMLPILDHTWKYPYVIGVGPTVILPSSFMIWLFGFSVTAARISAALYLLGSFIVMYIFSKKYINRYAACIGVGLMISLSALVNTGKVVMGEVPGLFFVFAGMLAWKNRPVLAGILFGLSAVSKLTMGIVYPALGVCIVLAILTKKWADLQRLLVMAGAAISVLAAWKAIEMTSDSSIIPFILERTGGGKEPPLQLLRENPQHLLRMPFLYFGGLCVLAITGIREMRKKFPRYLLAFIVTFIVVCIVYFLNNEGWYRHILPAHILLLPFVPIGAKKILGLKMATVLLCFFIVMQSWWQVTYRGSVKSLEAQAAADILNEEYRATPLIVRHSEVFVRYPNNENWFFLPLPEIASYSPKHLTKRSEETACLPEVWKISNGEQASYGKRLTQIHKRFVILWPTKDCL